MGGKSSPVAQISKAINDVTSTGFKGINDITNEISLDDNAVTDTLGKVAEGFKPIGEGAAGVVEGFGGAVSKIGQFGVDAVKAIDQSTNKEIAVKSAKNAQRDADRARAEQEASTANQLRVKAANKDSGKGSSIILGGKRKKRKGSSVSSGLGLSKGDTGLQT